MDYKEAIAYIESSQKLGSKLGFERIRTLLDKMKSPEKKLKIIHVGGTNGKGSTISFMSRILMAAGYKVGTYTSPSIHSFSEQISINGNDISEDHITRLAAYTKPLTDKMSSTEVGMPTEFELITAMAFHYFYEENCDFVLLEVGLGGRLDATNIIEDPELSLITAISYDHMAILGETLAEIAYEKAGIIKPNSQVVLYPQEEAALAVLEDYCEKQDAILHKVGFSTLKIHCSDTSKQVFDFEGYKSLEISLLGTHQINNALTALKAVEVLISKGYEISQDHIRQGLKKAKWPGRLEILSKAPDFFVDGAHNPQGAKALADNLSRLFPGKKIIFIVGILADKDYKMMMKPIIKIAQSFITVTPKSVRALKAEELESYLRPFGIEVTKAKDVNSAITKALQLALEDDIICAFGSLYYIGEVRTYFGLS